MNKRLFRTQFNQMENIEKQVLMESLAARYDMTFLGLHTFDRWGQNCTTGIFKKDGREMCIRDSTTKEERLEWPVTDEERNSEKGWGRFQNEQICRLKIRRMKEEWAKDLVAWPWCISEVVKTHEDCPELQAVLDECHKPVVIQDQVLGKLELDKDHDAFEGEIQWRGKDVLLSLEVNAESKPSWTRARSAAKKLLADCETWDKAMRELAAKNLTELANNWLSQDEEPPRNPETDPITEEELARRISLTSLSVTSGGSFTAWFDCDEMFTDHAVTIYGSLKKGLKTANIEG